VPTSQVIRLHQTN